MNSLELAEQSGPTGNVKKPGSHERSIKRSFSNGNGPAQS